MTPAERAICALEAYVGLCHDALPPAERRALLDKDPTEVMQRLVADFLHFRAEHATARTPENEALHAALEVQSGACDLYLKETT